MKDRIKIAGIYYDLKDRGEYTEFVMVTCGNCTKMVGCELMNVRNSAMYTALACKEWEVK